MHLLYLTKINLQQRHHEWFESVQGQNGLLPTLLILSAIGDILMDLRITPVHDQANDLVLEKSSYSQIKTQIIFSFSIGTVRLPPN